MERDNDNKLGKRRRKQTPHYDPAKVAAERQWAGKLPLLQPSHEPAVPLPPASGSAALVEALGGGAAFLVDQGVVPESPPAPAEDPQQNNPVANFAMGVVGAVSGFVSGLRGVFAGDPALVAEAKRDQMSACADDVNHEDMSDENDKNDDSERSGSSKAVDMYGVPPGPLIANRRKEAAALKRIVDKTDDQERRYEKVRNWLENIYGNPEKPYDNTGYFVVPDSVEIRDREVGEEDLNWNEHGPLANGRGFANHLGDRNRPLPNALRKIIQRTRMKVDIGHPDNPVEDMDAGNTVFTTQDPKPVLFTVVGPHGIGKSDSFPIQPLNSPNDWRIEQNGNDDPEYRLYGGFFAVIEDGTSIVEDGDPDLPVFDAKWEGWFHAHYDQVTGPVWVWPADGHIYIYIELPESQYCTIEKCQDDGVDYSLVIPGISAGNSPEEYSIWIRHAGVNPEERGLSSCDSKHDSDGDHNSGNFKALEQKYAKNPEQPVVVQGRYDEDSMQSVNSADLGSVSAFEGERSSSSGDWTGDSADGDAGDDSSAQESDRQAARNPAGGAAVAGAPAGGAAGGAAGAAAGATGPTRECFVCWNHSAVWIPWDCHHQFGGLCQDCYVEIPAEGLGRDFIHTKKCPLCKHVSVWAKHPNAQ